MILYLEAEQASEPQTHGFPVYFFFKHDDAERRSAKPMFRTILLQLIHKDETILRYLDEKCASMDSTELCSIKTLQALALDCLTSQSNACVVLDGLDECDDNEPEAILDWFLGEVMRAAASRGCHLKLLVCGQRDGRLDSQLSAYSQIRLDAVDSHKQDIEDYTKFRAAEIRKRFSQTAEDEKELVYKVAEASQGTHLAYILLLSSAD